MRPEAILLLPLAAFLNILCLRIPGWLASHSFFNHCAGDQDILYIMDPILKNMIIVSNLAGALSAVSLFFRLLLEKKIKALTRLIVISLLVQGIFSGWALLLFFVQYSKISEDWVMTEAPIYTLLVVVFSFWMVALLLQLQERNLRADHYNYLMDLSWSYRQLILLIISSMVFMIVMAECFCWVEGWSFYNSLYWVVSTLTTIGYGDIAPKSILGKVLLMGFALPGIALFGATIWAVRHVFLEYFALKLAHQYSEFLNIRQDLDSLEILHENELEHHRRSSDGELTLGSRKDKKKERSSFEEDTLDIRSLGRHRKTLVVSRGDHFPSLTVVGGDQLKKKEIQRMTRKTISVQIWFALLFEILHVLIFGGFFAFVEGWDFFEGIYFAVTSLFTIGFGDYILCGMVSRSVFIWYVFFGIASSTFFLAMLAESAFDQWSVTVQKIENRVGRYEKKAELKRLYKSKPEDTEHSADQKSVSEGQNSQTDAYIRIEKPQNQGMGFQLLSGLSFNLNKRDQDTESDFENRHLSSVGDSVDFRRWTESSEYESAPLIGNSELI